MTTHQGKTSSIVTERREGRRKAVVKAAIGLVLDVEIDWAHAITFVELSNRTGIDPAQIARDFGSKGAIEEAVIEELFAPERNGPYVDNTNYWLGEVASDRETPISDLLEEVGRFFESAMRSEAGRLLARQHALSGGGGAVTSASRRFATMNEELITVSSSLLAEAVDELVLQGAVVRDHFSTVEFITVADAALDGLILKHSMAPHLVPEGLIAKTLCALLTGLIGPDADTPNDVLNRIPRSPAGEA